MPNVLTERSGAILTITIHRPERLNALDVATMLELKTALQGATVTQEVRAVLLTGAGSAFCAGGDVAVMDEYRERGTLADLFHRLTAEQENMVREILTMPKPVVAAIPGVAAGGGLSLALAADWRIASTTALLVPAFLQLGTVPDGGLSYFLPHFLGIGGAQEMLFSNARVSAERAREMGLVHEVVPPADLAMRARARTEELARGPTRAYGWAKRLLVAAFSESVETQMALERRSAVDAAQGPELPEGIRAFREKRAPNFPSP
ncbi:MAG TPA: enoyl-CoA hydratase-related protein [Thermoplasmata archaeon]|jgi:2-(1,2-epoxy-1,2-dihydrophenyl)acetyl-CoA isomerase|nr:enoyl-CoA hydratase-related protein [Thermoplasmata archaeon]